eukprot:TRINITY_DN12327_c0_g1_i1.p1 TRINITY_DN12327_c0_g1~~TRINITY_DN12327_c0_g1_i1.p1  ORF type:complete len:151 (-),score=37.36 TRINITY_DN12327_c0_g1_i1:12-464(-)
MYEIFEYGREPFAEYSFREMFQFLKKGNRLPKPQRCPDEIYKLMLTCWSEKPEDRPTFDLIHSKISTVLEEYQNIGREGAQVPKETETFSHVVEPECSPIHDYIQVDIGTEDDDSKTEIGEIYRHDRSERKDSSLSTPYGKVEEFSKGIE